MGVCRPKLFSRTRLSRVEASPEARHVRRCCCAEPASVRTCVVKATRHIACVSTGQMQQCNEPDTQLGFSVPLYTHGQAMVFVGDQVSTQAPTAPASFPYTIRLVPFTITHLDLPHILGRVIYFSFVGCKFHVEVHVCRTITKEQPNAALFLSSLLYCVVLRS